MTRPGRMSVALVVAFLVAALAILPVTQDRAFLAIAGVLMIASAAIGAVTRRLGGNGAVATILQFIPGIVAWFATVGDDPSPLISETWTFVAMSVPPMEPHNGFRLISALGVWLLYLVGEILANDLEQPAWTFPVLLTPYLVPALGTRHGAPLEHSIWTGLAWVIVLIADAALRHRDTAGRSRGVSIAAASTALAAIGVSLALVVAPALPFGAPLWTITGTGLGGVAIWNDPNADLIRTLRLASNETVITYTTNQPGGAYLRLAALPAVDDNGFHDVTSAQLGLDQWSSDSGSDRGYQFRSITITSDKFASRWLPLPSGTTQFTVIRDGTNPPDDWVFDPLTHNVTASGNNAAIATLGARYTASFTVPSQRQLASARTGDPNDSGLTLALPAGLDVAAVTRLAYDAVTESDPAAQQALSLVSWFGSGQFTYDTAAVNDSTLGTINDFLFGSRHGYCEQFAGAMALMARTLGIPSRVAIGFLPGAQQADGSWAVATKQMHAWVQLYLTSSRGVSGWYDFDPTPASAIQAAAAATASAAPATEATPTPTPSATSSTEPSADPTASTAPVATPPIGATVAPPLWIGILVGVTLLALAVIPWTVRAVRRARRLSAHGPPERRTEDAWDELRDAVIDSGRGWPSGSPRQVAGELTPAFGPSLRTLALMVEQARFAQTMDDPADPAVLAKELGRSLRQQTSWRRRCWPRSVFGR